MSVIQEVSRPQWPSEMGLRLSDASMHSPHASSYMSLRLLGRLGRNKYDWKHICRHTYLFMERGGGARYGACFHGNVKWAGAVIPDRDSQSPQQSITTVRLQMRGFPPSPVNGGITGVTLNRRERLFSVLSFSLLFQFSVSCQLTSLAWIPPTLISSQI